MIRKLALSTLVLAMLAGCAGTQASAPDLKYTDMTPNLVVGVLHTGQKSSFGVNMCTEHLYEITHHFDPAGKDVCDKVEKVYSGSTSGPGEGAAVVGSIFSAAGGSAGAAFMTPFLAWLLSTPNATTNTTVKVTASK